MTNHRTIQPHARKVIVGVDTHTHVHVAVAIDTWGIRLGDRSCAADSDGYQQLITWAERHGRVAAFGIEGTGSYGAGLARAVRRAGHQVLEVNRGDRRTRRIAGKSDTVDAETAARSVLAGQSTAIPKTADGAVEMMRHLKVARRTAVKARTSAMITLKQIVVTAPPELRETLHPVLSKNPIDAVRRADSTLDVRRVATFVTAESLCSARPVCRLFPTCCSSSSWPSRAGSTSSRVTSLTLSRKRIASSESRSVLTVSGSPTPSAGAWPHRPRASGDGYAVTCTPWSRPRPSSAGIDS